jgi:hypothetical protein
MTPELSEIKVKGHTVKVPSVRIEDRTVVATGKWLHVAFVRGEDWTEGQVVVDPPTFIARLIGSGLKADIFTFSQKIPHVRPKYRYHMEWDNVAAIPITSYEDWWDELSSDMRRDVKLAEKRGVVVRTAPFDDDLIRGIMGIHDEISVKQGTPFLHKGKDFDLVKHDYGTYLDKSEFVGAYHDGELIGLLKIVHVGDLACLMQILAKDQHYDKRPANALIAKAVALSAERRDSYLTYGKYYYGNKRKSSLVNFKHRNGFQCVLFPRYYVPLTFLGAIAVALRLHRGILGILPGFLISLLLEMRSSVRQFLRRHSETAGGGAA